MSVLQGPPVSSSSSASVVGLDTACRSWALSVQACYFLSGYNTSLILSQSSQPFLRHSSARNGGCQPSYTGGRQHNVDPSDEPCLFTLAVSQSSPVFSGLCHGDLRSHLYHHQPHRRSHRSTPYALACAAAAQQQIIVWPVQRIISPEASIAWSTQLLLPTRASMASSTRTCRLASVLRKARYSSSMALRPIAKFGTFRRN